MVRETKIETERPYRHTERSQKYTVRETETLTETESWRDRDTWTHRVRETTETESWRDRHMDTE